MLTFSRFSRVAAEQIEGGADRAERAAVAVTTQRPTNDFDVGPVLERERQDDRGVAGVRVALIPGFVIVQKQFADPAIGESADRRSETQTV